MLYLKDGREYLLDESSLLMDLKKFIKKCFITDPNGRPTAADLLKDTFIINSSDKKNIKKLFSENRDFHGEL